MHVLQNMALLQVYGRWHCPAPRGLSLPSPQLCALRDGYIGSRRPDESFRSSFPFELPPILVLYGRLPTVSRLPGVSAPFSAHQGGHRFYPPRSGSAAAGARITPISSATPGSPLFALQPSSRFGLSATGRTIAPLSAFRIHVRKFALGWIAFPRKHSPLARRQDRPDSVTGR